MLPAVRAALQSQLCLSLYIYLFLAPSLWPSLLLRSVDAEMVRFTGD